MPDNNELGVDIGTLDTNVNLFEQFHKSSADGKEVLLNTQSTQQTDEERTKAELEKKKAEEGKPLEDLDETQKLLKQHTQTSTTKDDDDKGEVKNLDNNVFKTLYDHDIEVLGFEPLEDGEEITEEAYIEFRERNTNKLAETRAIDMIEKTFLSSPVPENAEVAKDLFNFLKTGGTVSQFLESRKNDEISTDYLSSVEDDDIKASRAKKVMTNYYSSIGWKNETIEKNIKLLETNGTLVAMAETTLSEFIDLKEKNKEKLDTDIKNKEQSNKTKIKEYNESVLNQIEELDEFATFDLKNKKDKQKLKEYMFLPTVDVNGNKVPQYMADLMKQRQNPKFAIFQALTFLNKGLDLDKITTKISNNAAATLKSKLEQAVAGNKNIEGSKSSQGSSNKQENVSSFLDFDNLQFT